MRTPRIGSRFPASWRRCRIALIGILALLGIVVLSGPVETAAASSTAQIKAKMIALGASPSAKASQKQLAAVIAIPSVSQLSKSLIATDKELTPFQRDMLEMQLLLSGRGVRSALLNAEQHHRLSSKQERLLSRVLVVLAHNPAVALLIQEGRALKAHPTTLSADLAALSQAPANSTGAQAAGPPSSNPLLNSVDAAILHVTSSGSAMALASSTRAILADPGAAAYVETLPPLIMASLIPPEQLISLQLKGGHAARSASRSFSHDGGHDVLMNGRPRHDRGPVARVADKQAAAFAVAEFAASQELNDFIGTLVSTGVAKAQLYPRLFALIGIALAPEELVAFEIAGTIVTIAQLTNEIYGFVPKLIFITELQTLQITPGSQTVAANKVQTYQVAALNAAGANLGIVQAHLSIAGGECLDAYQNCKAGAVGPHEVIATYDGAEGKTTLTIVPGPLVHLRLSPRTAQTTVGVPSTEFTAEGEDAGDNDLGPVTNFTLEITSGIGGSCTGHTCTAEFPGPYTVTARDGQAEGTASLFVNAGGLDYLKLTPETSSVVTGTPQLYRIEGFDMVGDLLGTLGALSGLGQATLTIEPDGTCDQSAQTCTPEAVGEYTVTATAGAATGTATLHSTAYVGRGENRILPDDPNFYATEGNPFDEVLSLEENSQEAVRWEIISGSLPNGIKFETKSTADGLVGELVGVPVEESTNTFKIAVYNEHAEELTSQTVTIVVGHGGALDIDGMDGDDIFTDCTDCNIKLEVVAGEPFEMELFADGGESPYTWTIAGSTEPYDCLSLKEIVDPENLPEVLEGDLPSVGTFVIPVEVQDEFHDVGKVELEIENLL